MGFQIQKGDVECSLDLFGGIYTEANATDIPAGVACAASDMDFIPGSTSSRKGLKKVFATPMGTNTVTYAKTYTDPAGVVRNLYLDSAGNLRVENVTASPGTYTTLSGTTAASYAKSVTAFGREYIAISNGLHGADIPLQYDGTNLDRVTQDGPGTPPAVSTFSIPSVAMVATGAPGVLVLYEIDPTGGDENYPNASFYPQVNIFITGSAAAVEVGQFITIAGTTATFNNPTYSVIAVYDGANSLIVARPNAVFPAGTLLYAGAGTVTISSGVTMTRAENVVTVKTAAAHQLQVGYQAKISSVTAYTLPSVTKIVINNADLPGIATVTTGTTAHGLIPGAYISLTGVTAVTVGTAAAVTATRAGQVVTVDTSTAHGLSPGAVITTSGFTTQTSFNTTAVVAQVMSTTQFTFFQSDVDSSDTGGTVTINWPIPDTPTPQSFQVVAAPTATTFQIAINYSDSPASGWTNGTVKFAWNGTFYVKAVIDTTTFQYQQYGPNATSSVVGTVTPYGQCAPGKHQLQVFFLTRQGYTTRPSPPVTFTANGGQYISVNNIPIGPSNVVARGLAFTGANGAYFFYIPSQPQVNGQPVGTQTLIEDNTSTSAVLDFSDNTLFAATGISIQGNNLANQIVIDGALGFGFFGSRLVTYGQRNTVQNLLNMGFDGGYLPSATTLPTGWTNTVAGGALAAGRYGSGWLITTSAGAGAKGTLTQGVHEDAYGAPIARGSTRYKIRGYFLASAVTANLTFTASLTSATTSFSTTATISGSLMSTTGSFLEATFSLPTPVDIPADLTLSIYASSVTTSPTLLIDELSLIYADNPYLDGLAYGSYVNNPEGFDGVSGKFGPVQDTHKLMDFGLISNNLYLLTQDPSGRLHEVINNGVTEPSGWQVDEIDANCGTLSAFAMTRSQSDDATAAGGERWFAWASASGARIFGGGQPWKISQEIQPDWDSINTAARLTIWAVNDNKARVLYFGLPLGSATAPNKVYIMSYRNLDSATQIANADPVRIGGRGQLAAFDNSRKWCPWAMTMNGAAMLNRSAGSQSLTFLGGNGQTPGAAVSYGNVYTLSAAYLTDDDYGRIYPYYTPYFFVTQEDEQALGLGAHRKTLAYLTAQVSGVGTVTITPYVNNLSNPWSLVCTRTLALNPNYDLEWAGGSVTGQRIAFKISVAPTSGTDNSLTIQKLVPILRAAARLPLRGKA
tara:strand:- start:739 stop:4323 length:3585 start_codon:yes stop_codon:yes gene_type:complete